MRSARFPGVLAGVVMLCAALAATPARAGNGKQIKKLVEQKRGAVFYLRSNVPYVSGTHAFGVYKKPLIRCTPKGLEAGEAAEMTAGFGHAEGRTLSLRINDQVGVDEVDYEKDDDEIKVEIKGAGRSIGKGLGVIALVGLVTPAELESCWNEIFSTVSIETKYDWTEEIRQAVVARKVTQGMTRDMVLVALGLPDKVTKATANGKDEETWLVQEGEGTKMGYMRAPTSDKREVSIRFVDGRVVLFEGRGGSDLKVK